MSSEKQSESASSLACSHCDRILANKNSLRRHEILKHNWDIATENTVTANVACATLEKNPGKQSSRAQVSEDLFGTVSETTSGDGEEEHSQKEISATGTTTARGRTGWSLTPKPVTDTANPCQRKRFEAPMPKAPVKKQAMCGAVSSAPSTSVEVGELDVEGDDEWPNRALLPSVRDIIAYRETVSTATTPKEISEMAKKKFGWTEVPTVSTTKYGQGVVAASDQVKRA